MKRFFQFGAMAVAAAAIQANALDVTLAPSGEVRFGGDASPCVLRPAAALPGWRSLSCKGGWTIEKPGVVPFDMSNGTNLLVRAVATIEQLPDGKARIVYSYTPVEDVELVVLGGTLFQPAASVAGRPWKAGGRSGVFARPKDGGITLLHGKGAEASVALGDTGRTLTFAMDREQGLHIQDNWKWGREYVLRIGTLARRTWRKGETQRYAFTVSADEPIVAKSDLPLVIEPGDDWIPIKYRREIEPGSALDFSGMGFTDAPAGKYGWMRNAGGHFEFEGRPGKPVRLYGVNLCFTANFPSHAVADALVVRLKRLGYNSIRLHHHDGGTVAGSKDGLALNAEKMDRFDYLFAAAAREGLYLTTDLFVSRTSAPITWRHIGVDRDGAVPQQLFKALCAVHEPAFANWCAYARNFLTHVNPYTGRAYKDEPALPLISLINEGTMTMGWDVTRDDARVCAAWRKWLLEKRAEDPSFYPAASPDRPPKSVWSSGEGAALALFMGEVEARMASRMKTFLRGLGCRALITNDNCGGHAPPMQMASAQYDYIDDHFYVDHPVFLEKKWRLPSRCANSNPVLSANTPPCAKAFTRMDGKPFTISEWNFSGPGMYRGTGGLLTGVMAAQQDWDGLWRFAYSHRSEDLVDSRDPAPGYFNLSTDPLAQANDRAAICLFLRGDAAPLPAEDGVSLLVTPQGANPADGRTLRAAPSWANVAWNMRVGSCLAAKDSKARRVIARDRAEEPAVTNLIAAASGSPALRIDRARGAFTVDTPRTCGGFAPDGTIAAGPMTATLGGAAATVWATSLDEAPVSSSRRILLTHITDVQGSGTKFAGSDRKILLKFGRGSLVRNGTARISLALANPESFKVYELETSGRRLGTLPAEVRDGRLEFMASVPGTHGARILYEIAQ